MNAPGSRKCGGGGKRARVLLAALLAAPAQLSFHNEHGHFARARSPLPLALDGCRKASCSDAARHGGGGPRALRSMMCRPAGFGARMAQSCRACCNRRPAATRRSSGYRDDHHHHGVPMIIPPFGQSRVRRRIHRQGRHLRQRGERDAAGEGVFGRQRDAALVGEIDGAGEPLVLIHGFSLDTRVREPQRAAFTRDHQVIRYDLRGFGALGAAGWCAVSASQRPGPAGDRVCRGAGALAAKSAEPSSQRL